MSQSLDTLSVCLQNTLGDALVRLERGLGELTLVVRAASLVDAVTKLRDHQDLQFSQLIDLCGMDYSGYQGISQPDARYAVVMQLMSVVHNARVRVRVFCPDDGLPIVPTVSGVWPSANWFEREAFDLFGIVFEGHPDLRRILTDYGFVGHPFRKDFPLSGNVEMRYDPVQGRVIYQPVSIEPREITPRIVREEHYGEGR